MLGGIKFRCVGEPMIESRLFRLTLTAEDGARVIRNISVAIARRVDPPTLKLSESAGDYSEALERGLYPYSEVFQHVMINDYDGADAVKYSVRVLGMEAGEDLVVVAPPAEYPADLVLTRSTATHDAFVSSQVAMDHLKYLRYRCNASRYESGDRVAIVSVIGGGSEINAFQEVTSTLNVSIRIVQVNDPPSLSLESSYGVFEEANGSAVQFIANATMSDPDDSLFTAVVSTDKFSDGDEILSTFGQISDLGWMSRPNGGGTAGISASNASTLSARLASLRYRNTQTYTDMLYRNVSVTITDSSSEGETDDTESVSRKVLLAIIPQNNPPTESCDDNVNYVEGSALPVVYQDCSIADGDDNTLSANVSIIAPIAGDHL